MPRPAPSGLPRPAPRAPAPASWWPVALVIVLSVCAGACPVLDRAADPPRPRPPVTAAAEPVLLAQATVEAVAL